MTAPKFKIVVVVGNTSSGKTTISTYLKDKYFFAEFHPYGFRKRQLEEHYGCPDLDTQEGKRFTPKDLFVNMEAIMDSEYHLYKDLDPFYTARRLRGDLSSTLEYEDAFIADYQDVCVVSIRNPAEVIELLQCISEYKDSHQPFFFRVDRPGYTGSSTDNNLTKIWSIFNSAYPLDCYILRNLLGVDYLYMQVEEMLDLKTV